MEKRELERKLECAEFYAKSLEHKIETIELKAEAYDRLMSGGKKTMKELIIGELEEQQCHLCGDESFDAGWKAGLEKAIEIVKEVKPMSGLSTLATTTSCDIPDNTVVVGLCKDCARHGRCFRELSSIQVTEGGVTMACDDYVQNTATPTIITMKHKTCTSQP